MHVGQGVGLAGGSSHGSLLGCRLFPCLVSSAGLTKYFELCSILCRDGFCCLWSVQCSLFVCLLFMLPCLLRLFVRIYSLPVCLFVCFYLYFCTDAVWNASRQVLMSFLGNPAGLCFVQFFFSICFYHSFFGLDMCNSVLFCHFVHLFYCVYVLFVLCLHSVCLFFLGCLFVSLLSLFVVFCLFDL